MLEKETLAYIGVVGKGTPLSFGHKFSFIRIIFLCQFLYS